MVEMLANLLTVIIVVFVMWVIIAIVYLLLWIPMPPQILIFGVASFILMMLFNWWLDYI
jgi:hypothetical protein